MKSLLLKKELNYLAGNIVKFAKSGYDLEDEDIKEVISIFKEVKKVFKKYERHLDIKDENFIRNQWGLVNTLMREISDKINKLKDRLNNI